MSDAANAPSYDLAAWRRQIPALESVVPLANCSHAPLTSVVRQALRAYEASWDRDVMDWDAWMEQVDRSKAAFARLINADPDEIALASSVTAAVATVASALELRAPRNRVLVTEAEFPTVGHVWLAQQRYGARVEWVPLSGGIIDPDAYASRIDERTALVCACHAYYVNGFKQDLTAIARLAHEQGAQVFVDAYQTVGLHPVDVRATGVDFLASGVHKFLMGIPGIAFLYVRRELIDRLQPALTGWFGREEIFAFDGRKLDWAPTAARFEVATPPVAGAYAARAGIEMIEQIGIDAIRDWTDRLGARAIEGARERGLEIDGTADLERKTATTAVRWPGDAKQAEDRLRRQGIVVASRGPVVRLAPHFFNTPDEIDRALDALAALA